MVTDTKKLTFYKGYDNSVRYAPGKVPNGETVFMVYGIPRHFKHPTVAGLLAKFLDAPGPFPKAIDFGSL